MRCASCNLLLQPDYKYCPYCGKKLEESKYTYFEIRQMRIDQGYKQEDVASALGVTPGEVSRYERGVYQYPKRVYTKLARFFSLDPACVETECEKPLLGLADLRKERKWTQAYLASLTGIKAGELSDYEQQGLCPAPTAVRKLAQTFGVPEAELAVRHPQKKKAASKKKQF
ncbi:MAG: helix-turn-helix domain-containing protein [Clostridia bacterium]|nr:helix-turn-helix domain-containing protein [Clostridia bacterium]